jgi:hypothetical protein
MKILKTDLGEIETERRVIEAILEAEIRGRLSRNDAIRVLDMMNRELARSSGTSYFVPGSPRYRMERESFERALKVVPGRDDPHVTDQAREIIAAHLESSQVTIRGNRVTSADKARGDAWLLDHDKWLDAQRGESQDEPLAED